MARRGGIMVFSASSLLISQALQVIGHLVASSNEKVEKGLLDGVDAGASGEEGAVRGAVDNDGFVSLFALEFLCAENDAEGVGEEDGGVGCEQIRSVVCLGENLVTVKGFVGHCCGCVWWVGCWSRVNTCRGRGAAVKLTFGVWLVIGTGRSEEKEERWWGDFWRTIYRR
ncbi:hypothetical protein E4T47_03675 [Aureobasidium subglaciale]|nr:hypothetical protein E4T43_02913 [Aureobasidium subglaciale]KAI5273181.1 hypothetical protein E4T47_03675 [Aureobasidium subglaciale]